MTKKEWAYLPETMSFVKALKDRREAIKEAWATGQLDKDTIEATALQMAAHRGAIVALQELISAIEEVQEEEVESA